MNADRRETLKNAEQELALAKEHLGIAETLIELAYEGEQEFYDNIPERLQQGSKGERAEEVVNTLSEATTTLESVADLLEEIEELLGKAGE